MIFYNSERQYPPKAYDSSTTETTTTEILNKTSYKQTITLNTTGITYGSGDYILYSSSVFTFGDQNLYRKRDLFNFTSDIGGVWDVNYNAVDGNYLGLNFIKNYYFGDWIIIKLPTPITLSKFIFWGRFGLISRSPSLWKCYGSNDGITFTEIDEASNSTTALINTDYPSLKYQKSLFTFNTPYLYIGFTFNKTVGGTNGDILNFTKLQLFGRERIQPYYVSSNAFNNMLTSLNLINSNTVANLYLSSNTFFSSLSPTYVTNVGLSNQLYVSSNVLSKVLTPYTTSNFISSSYLPKVFTNNNRDIYFDTSVQILSNTQQ
jgi:hypothetical protein